MAFSIQHRKRTIIAALAAAIFIGGCAAAQEGAGETAEKGNVNGTLPSSFINLAADAALTQDANEETHIQTNVLDLGKEKAVGYFRILWPDLDVQEYTIEGSADGEAYETLYTSEKAPYFTEDLIGLDTTVTARYIRLSGIAANALPVPEVYAEDPWNSVEDELSIALAENAEGDTLLTLSGVPDGVEVTYGGCDYEEVVTALTEPAAEAMGMDGKAVDSAFAVIQDTIADKTVSVGFTLSVDTATGTWSHDTGDYEVNIPAQDAGGSTALGQAANTSEDVNSCPDVIPALQEWDGGVGTVELSCEEAERVQASSLTASALSDGSERVVQYEIVADASLGEEGYRIDLGCGRAQENHIVVYAGTQTGLYWGNVTLRQMLVLAENLDVQPGEEDHAGIGIAADTEESGGAADGAIIALPRGRIRDYPIGSVRGIMLDVGRNTMSLAQIEQIARNLSWYKMNELTLHLQDNALLTYSDKTDSVENARTAYSAYRMESSITGEDGTSITADDLSYTAEDFAALVDSAAQYGVSIIPEIDTPAHSLALTAAFPDLGLSGRADAVDMLDCGNPDALALAERVWDEQLSAAFVNAETIQIGGDEYYGQANDFIRYETGLIDHLAASGKTIRMWGSLTALLGDARISPIVPGSWNPETALEDSKSTGLVNDTAMSQADETGDAAATETADDDATAVTLAQQQAAEDGILPADRIQMQLWSTYWADPETMYRAGFALINSSSNKLYINCGEATDYLDKESLYNTYRRTEYTMDDGSAEILPSWSPRVIGSSAALWNDLIDNLEIGICEYDMTDRVLDALPVLAAKFWQEDDARSYDAFLTATNILGTAPDSDPLHTRDDLFLRPEYTISFEVYLPSSALSAEESSGTTDEAYTIFREEIDGNTYAFKARQQAGDGEGRVGFSREFRDYAFDYALPTDTWVRLTVVGSKDQTALYVNDVLVDTLGSSAAYEEHATFLFPVTVNPSFVGEVRGL